MNEIETLKESQQRLARDLRQVVRDAEGVLRHSVKEAGEGYDEARNQLEQSVKTAKRQLSDLEQALLDRTKEAAHAADHYVRTHPWESIGVGTGIGLLLGMLIARR